MVVPASIYVVNYARAHSTNLPDLLFKIFFDDGNFYFFLFFFSGGVSAIHITTTAPPHMRLIEGIMSGVMNPFLNWLTIGSKIKAFHPRNPAWAFYFLGLSFLPHVFFVAHSLIV